MSLHLVDVISIGTFASFKTDTLLQFKSIMKTSFFYLKYDRYESTTRSPYGEVESAYAYDVDGQTVRVARIDSPKYY